MKLATNLLKVGDVMASGEVVKHTERVGSKLRVILYNPKKDYTREAYWNYNGTIFLSK